VALRLGAADETHIIASRSIRAGFRAYRIGRAALGRASNAKLDAAASGAGFSIA